MNINVKFFASLREEFGAGTRIVENKNLLTIEDIWSEAANCPPPKNLLCAVNHEYADFKHKLEDGDEVAFFPPVNGG